jgi:hypothetical protein
MTPGDLVGMAVLNGVQLLALTDHNSARNCPAAARAAQAYGIGFIAGMEVTTSEDIHAVCLFPDLQAALDFDRFLYPRLRPVKNRPKIFGRQIFCDENGEPAGEEPQLLIVASDISIMELPGVVGARGGLCYPAHVSREGNGLLAVLGGWPPELSVRAAELDHGYVPENLPAGLKLIRASDAHRFADMPEPGFSLPLKTADFEGLFRWMAQD